MLTLYNKLDIHACDVTSWFSEFWRTDVSLKEFFGNALVLLPHNSDAINPPTWYLIYEVRMIVLIPLLVFICNIIITLLRFLPQFRLQSIFGKMQIQIS